MYFLYASSHYTACLFITVRDHIKETTLIVSHKSMVITLKLCVYIYIYIYIGTEDSKFWPYSVAT
jgi:hypothetical protein